MLNDSLSDSRDVSEGPRWPISVLPEMLVVYVKVEYQSVRYAKSSHPVLPRRVGRYSMFKAGQKT